MVSIIVTILIKKKKKTLSSFIAIHSWNREGGFIYQYLIFF